MLLAYRIGGAVFSLKRQGDFRLQLSRTLTKPGRHQVELYLFTPHETTFSSRALTEEQFFQSALTHRFRLLGLPAQDRASKLDTSYSLLSPHYEIMHGASFSQFQASLDRLRQQLQGNATAEPLTRALRLSQNYAQRLRKAEPKQSKQSRYFRQLDIYFSWLAEQFLLESMTLEGFADLDEELQQAVRDFLHQEHRYRAERGYLSDFRGGPTRVWNRMSLYHRLLEYPVVLRQQLTALGAGTRKLVKAASTMLIMSLFTYFLFNVRDASQKMSLALLAGIALVYAVRDLLRDDLIDTVTRWLRKGKPRWKIRLLMPYTQASMAQQLVWLDYRKLSELSKAVREHSSKWAANEERQIVCYRSWLHLEKAALVQDELQERLILDCEPLCAMIQASHQQLFEWTEAADQPVAIQAHTIEKQHDYNMLLVHHQPGQEATVAQRWTLRLGAGGIVRCVNKSVNWPEPPKRRLWRRA
ncbi:hypothetical protein SAMN05216535_0166 [Stutzerimonas xanthomarina]|uniref:Uncharacterized protein n=2 Tax=Stutzerimonas xanthomarina TaxID=271420 RepID=A0A1M5L5J6_9GAMM|nr:hypothetical protein [Stutzerimonas xanthomarina]SEH51120.1 hypothetical protein SAMN05216535_0166 [Stutzerimonas xanthomarina]SHG60246.1 hypothetical protein SAMN02744645_0868 [Stutzerimonas xanthomarina DSM 18231]